MRDNFKKYLVNIATGNINAMPIKNTPRRIGGWLLKVLKGIARAFGALSVSQPKITVNKIVIKSYEKPIAQTNKIENPRNEQIKQGLQEKKEPSSLLTKEEQRIFANAKKQRQEQLKGFFNRQAQGLDAQIKAQNEREKKEEQQRLQKEAQKKQRQEEQERRVEARGKESAVSPLLNRLNAENFKGMRKRMEGKPLMPNRRPVADEVSPAA